MKMAVEIYTEKPLSIKGDTYFKTALLAGGAVLAGSGGCDRYDFPYIATSEKRVAGLGREFTYTLAAFPAGMGPIEARPGRYLEFTGAVEDIDLSLETNLILDPGALADSLGVRFVNERGKGYDVPLCRPDVRIRWDGRGKYTVSLAGLLHSKLLQAVS
ncbi:MAG: hypothetical protein ACOY40_06780 [Bacillota bacterium]